MKKLIAILMILGLFAATAFAEVAVSGTAAGAFDLVQSSGGADADAAFIAAKARIKIEGTNDDETFGGYVQLRGESSSITDHYEAWWQPIPQFKLQIGREADGILGADGSVVGWGYHGDASDYVVIHNYDLEDAFFSGWGAFGPSLTISPIEGLDINFAIPVSTAESYKHLLGQVSFTADFGQIVATFTGGAGNIGTVVVPFIADPSSIYGAFHLTAIEGLDLSVGIKYSLPVKDTVGIIDLAYYSPFLVGFGAAFATDSFGVKARLTAGFGEKDESTVAGITTTTESKALFELSVMPYFDLGIFQVFVDLGFATQDEFDFFINPYITKTIGSGTFFAGFRLETAKPSDDLNWGVPIGVQFNF
jgi:hypothetical protein